MNKIAAFEGVNPLKQPKYKTAIQALSTGFLLNLLLVFKLKNLNFFHMTAKNFELNLREWN
ncbi:MAG: hypothetical protein ACK4IY_03720, partial [Chitinophagales bacterium]